jgi:hypothetical protein
MAASAKRSIAWRKTSGCPGKRSAASSRPRSQSLASGATSMSQSCLEARATPRAWGWREMAGLYHNLDVRPIYPVAIPLWGDARTQGCCQSPGPHVRSSWPTGSRLRRGYLKQTSSVAETNKRITATVNASLLVLRRRGTRTPHISKAETTGAGAGRHGPDRNTRRANRGSEV